MNGVHRYDADVRNGLHANVCYYTSTCADAQYHDGHDKADDMVLQTDHSYIHCAAFSCSYNHIGYNHVTYNTMHNSHNYDCYSIRDHGHVHDRGWVEVVSNQNEYSSQSSLH